MKILIAVDMEGITGVSNWDHVTPSHMEYARFRRLMTQDVNAAIRGAIDAGMEEVIVADGHWNGQNIMIEELDGRARLNSGTASPFSMIQGVAGGAQAAFFIGYHARAGSQNAVLDHTWSSARVANLWLNGRLCGETGLNASVCGAYGIPVLLVSGDQTVAAEACDWIPGIETAIVKNATSRFSAESLAPEAAHQVIYQAAVRAVRRFHDGQGAPEPLHIGKPVTVTVEFFSSAMADGASLTPGSVRLDGRRVEIQAADMPAAYNAFRTLVALGDRH